MAKATRFLVCTALASGLLMPPAVALAGNGTPINPNSANPLTLAVYGDSPYGTTPTDNAQLLASPAFIANINADLDVDLVVHVGDIHSGKQYCTEAYDLAIFDLWSSFKDPLVYTPGDNEWADCHKVAEGGGAYNKVTGQIDYVHDSSGNLVDYAGGDPIANLDLLRTVFFSNPGYTLGGRSKQVLSQADNFDPAYPSDANYVENVMWEQSRVVFVTINLPGGGNNDNDIWYGTPTMSAAQSQEIAERTAADLHWLDAAFALAEADDAEAVLIVAQADMWDNEKGPFHQAQFEPIVQNVAWNTSDFGKSVLMFNGDSHAFVSDNPLSDPLNLIHPGYDVPNFHRIVVHGSTLPLEWLKFTITPGTDTSGDSAFGPFSWQRVIP